MSRFDTMKNKSLADQLDDKIYQCALELNEMEEHFREQIGEEFEYYLGLLHHYTDLLNFKTDNKIFDNIG